MPAGGQPQPISTEGDSEKCKNAQKKDKKKNTSETMNKTKPNRSPDLTREV